VTKSATEVSKQDVGICGAKANLFAAMLRACGIPAGICYQCLTLGDVPENGNCLPDSIFEYKRATIEDIDELVRTRIIVLRAANKLSDEEDMSLVEKESHR